MPLAVDSRDLTTFVYNNRRYRFTCSQWGLLNSATSFQRYIDSVVSDLAGVSVYMDDILVYAPNVDTMLMCLRFLFNRLRDANLIINSEKCKLLKRAVPYLGNVLQHGIVRPDPARVIAILDWHFPATTSELRSFIGAAAMLSRHVPEYGFLKGILHPLLSTKTLYLPTPSQLEACSELKQAIADACLLRQPMAGEPMIVRTDASSVGLGAVLYQLGHSGEIMPLYYLSRSLHDVETRYDVRKLELLAIKWALASLDHRLSDALILL